MGFVGKGTMGDRSYGKRQDSKSREHEETPKQKHSLLQEEGG